MIPRVGLFWPEGLHHVLSHHTGWDHEHFPHEVCHGVKDFGVCQGVNGVVGFRHICISFAFVPLSQLPSQASVKFQKLFAFALLVFCFSCRQANMERKLGLMYL